MADTKQEALTSEAPEETPAPAPETAPTHGDAKDSAPGAKEVPETPETGEEAAKELAKEPDKEPDKAVPVVEFRSVTKTFNPGTKNAFTAIRDVTFTVEDVPDRGEFITVVGPSGCGKSTILRLIAALSPHHPATAGEVLVNGVSVGEPSANRGMVFQSYTSFPHRTVLDNVAFGLECRGARKSARYEQARHWIERVGLSVPNDQYKYPHQLSGGMRQRVAIARTLILKPRIIMMDEPFGALDPTTRLHMQDLLVSLWREVEATVFFVTHDITEAVYLGDRCYVLSSSPGTLLKEIPLPHPDRPAAEMQREASFQETVYELRDIIEQLEEGKD